MSDVQNPAATPDAAAPQQKVTLHCPKHGDITATALFLNFKGDDGKPKQFLYCLPCLNEVLLSLQKEGAIQTVQVQVEDPNAAPPAEADAVTAGLKKVVPNLISAAPAPETK